MLEIVLITLLAIVTILLFVALWFIRKLANIVFVYEDDITTFSNFLVDVNDRLEQVQQIRALMSHPSAATYIAESFEEIRYCRFLLEAMVRKSRMLLKKDYTELEVNAELVPLHQRLEQYGIYDPEEDGEVNVMSKQETKELIDHARALKNKLTKQNQ